MPILNTIISWYLKKRESDIQRIISSPHEVQEEVFSKLIKSAKDTVWGKQYNYANIKTVEQFKREVPIGNYESHSLYIERIMKGEQNVLWPSEVKWFAKSSGTTSAKSKFIPVTYESLEECHFQGGKDAMLMYLINKPESEMFEGKGLIVGGSHQLNQLYTESNSFYGDLSAVMMQNMPFWAHYFRTPDLSIAIMDNWDEKLEKMARATLNENVTNISGVPTWTIMLIEKLFEITGKSNLKDIWPNIELYIHGGVSYVPYKKRFERMIQKEDMHYLETYNASEGFLGIQHRLNKNDMLLMLDYGIYYEFMPMEEYGKDHPKTYALHEVEPNINYAIVMSSNAGLWRYIIGDTIKFTSINPFLFKISGRTKHYINAFGEELIVENADQAIANACLQCNATVKDYTAAPIFFNNSNIGTHEWVIEFENTPDNMQEFCKVLDEELKKLNSDYEAKRYNDIAIIKPIIHAAPAGTFHSWLKMKGKLGGQHKVPRLCNSREYMDEILGLYPRTSSI
jgi:hypothetical protein